jgi:hypothetical protein
MKTMIQPLVLAYRRPLYYFMLFLTAVSLVNCAFLSPSKPEKEKSWVPPPGAQFVTEQGWLKEFLRPGGNPTIQLHTKDKIYWLVDTPNAKYTPAQDVTKEKVKKWSFGEDHEYIVKGYVGNPLTVEWFGSHPVLYGIEFNRIK